MNAWRIPKIQNKCKDITEECFADLLGRIGSGLEHLDLSDTDVTLESLQQSDQLPQPQVEQLHSADRHGPCHVVS